MRRTSAVFLTCIERTQCCVVILSNDVCAERAFPHLVASVLGNSGVAWHWEDRGMKFRGFVTVGASPSPNSLSQAGLWERVFKHFSSRIGPRSIASARDRARQRRWACQPSLPSAASCVVWLDLRRKGRDTPIHPCPTMLGLWLRLQSATGLRRDAWHQKRNVARYPVESRHTQRQRNDGRPAPHSCRVGSCPPSICRSGGKSNG